MYRIYEGLKQLQLSLKLQAVVSFTSRNLFYKEVHTLYTPIDSIQKIRVT